MGLWHARLLAAVARALRARGFRCVFALADPVLARAALRPEDAVVPAPVYVPAGAVVPAGVRTKSFADILGACGWSQASVVGALMASWDALIGLVGPDVVVADHAPTLLLAARGRAPRVSVGLGFTTPPAGLPSFPDLHDGPPGTFGEAAVKAAVNRALGARGAGPLARLPQALEADATFVTVMADLDPYQGARTTPALGPVGAPRAPAAAAPTEEGVFAYLAAEDPRTEPTLTWLAGRGPVRAFVRRADAATRARLEAAGVTVRARPADLAVELGRADVVVHHGGAGLTQQAALAGRAQLLLPRHLEQQWNAQVVARQGAGRVAVAPGEAALSEALDALRQPRVAQLARAWAEIAGAQLTPDPAGVIAERCAALTRR